MPGQQWQTRYPPLFPILLSAVVDPMPKDAFGGGGLAWVTFLAWAAVPLLLVGVLGLYRSWGIPTAHAIGAVALVGLNGYVAAFGATVMSEVLFTAVLVASLCSVSNAEGRGNSLHWVLGGALGGLAFLTRTLGLPLALCVPVWAFWRRKTNRAPLYAAAMLPFVIAWGAWATAHRTATPDLTIAYYTDYVSDFLGNVTWANFPLVVWKNIDAFLTGIGSLLVPGLKGSAIGKLFVQTVAVGSIVGTVRLCKQHPAAQAYGIYGIFASLMLIVWCYPPNERLVFPLFPLLAAGVIHEISYIASNIRSSATSQIASKRTFRVVLLSLLCVVVVQHIRLWAFIPRFFQAQSRMATDDRACFERIRNELPADARLVAHNDPVLYLYTGRNALRLKSRPALWYEDKRAAMLDDQKNVVAFSKSHSLAYVFQNLDFTGDLNEQERTERNKSLLNNESLELQFSCGSAHVWRVRSSSR